MSPAWTLDYVMRVHEGIKRDQHRVTPRDEAYHPQVALLSSFRLDEGTYVGAPAEALREDSVPAPGSPSRFMLKDAIRRRVLRELATRDALRAALQANVFRPDDDLQQLIEAALDENLPPLDDQTPERLGAILQVVDWFAETELRTSLPSASRLRALLERESLLGPLRELGGDHFRGRSTELAALRAYVDDISDERNGRRLPLLIFGPGGMGKSALVAKFILNNVGRLPLAYLDCDRPGIVAMEPVTMLAEIVRQLALQFAELGPAATQLRDRWLARLTASSETSQVGQAPLTMGRDRVMNDLKLFIGELPLEHRRLLLVIDTFEEVQYRSRAIVEEVFAFLGELQTLLPRLRTVLVGRNAVPGSSYIPLEIGALDLETAHAVLNSLGVAPESVVEVLARHLRGNPLSLWLAAELWYSTGGSGLDDVAAIAHEVDLQGTLYGRILNHVHDETVRSIAHPGLILRRITPEIIMQVLAQPCNLGPTDLRRATELFGLLREEMSLVVSEGDAVHHRRDVRRIMLRPLRKDRQQLTRRIEEAAIRYYSDSENPADRAEEIYHRLSLNQPVDLINTRWIPGIEESLHSAVDELEGESRTYLAARLGIELYDVALDEVDQVTWELVAARHATALLELDKPLEAIALLRRRSQRSPGSPLIWLHAQALRRGGFLLEAREVSRVGLTTLLADPQSSKLKTDIFDSALAQPLMDWYCGADLAEPPGIADVDRQYRWLLQQQKLRQHTGSFFVGRRSETAAIDAYVSSPSTSSLAERPPLFIQGVGGSGKSALMADYLLQKQKDLPFVWLGKEIYGEPGQESALLRVATEIASQLSYQMRDEAFAEYARSLVSPDGEKPAMVHNRISAALGEALQKIKVLASGERALLIVVDDFDTVQFHDHDLSDDLYSLLSSLHRSVPRLRLVFLGRVSPPRLGFEILSIGPLDAQSVESFLVSQGVDSEEARATIIRMSSGNPLAMRLMVESYREGGDLPSFEHGEVGAFLLARIISHIPDSDVRKILASAVIVRQITREVLSEVLAGPSGVALTSNAEARELFEKLAREVAFFVRKGDTLTGRPDLRRLLLPVIRANNPEAARATDRAAIAYYEPRDTVADRAEEIYHRLAASEDLARIEDRWKSGVEDYLAQATDDFSGPAREFLQDKLGHGFDWLDANQTDWEDHVGTRADYLVETNRAEEALELLRKRSTRLPRSRLFVTEAAILIKLGQPREALAIVQDGLTGKPDDPDLLALSERCLSVLGIEEGASSADRADPARLRMRGLAQAILSRGGRRTIATLLSRTFPTVSQMMSAWQEFRLEKEVPMDGPKDTILWRIIAYASARGILEELLIAALEYASQSPLADFAEGRSPTVTDSQGLPGDKAEVIEASLIFDRILLRRFIATLGMSAYRQHVLLVDGPPGSGKSSTSRIARRLSADLESTSRTIAISLDEMRSPSDLARELFTIFGWRWEERPSSLQESSARTAQRYAQIISDRIKRTESPLLVFEAQNASEISDGLRYMIAHLAKLPNGPAMIVVGMGQFFESLPQIDTAVEVLHNFTRADIVDGLTRFMIERDLSGDPVQLAELILEKAAGVVRYNAEISKLAHQYVSALLAK